VSGVTAADYQATRSFLLRAATLDPWTRERLAREIATAILPRLRHQPPPGVSPEVFLVCVAALYQARQRRSPGLAAPWSPQPPAAPPGMPPAAPPATPPGGPPAAAGSPTFRPPLAPAAPARPTGDGGFLPPD
jgi:hypothetical protein